MAFKAGTGVIDLELGTDKLRGGASKVGGVLNNLKTNIVPIIAGFYALQKIFDTIKSSMDAIIMATENSVRANANLQASLTSMSHAGGFTYKQLQAQADAFQKVTEFSSENITGNLQALLATFGEIRGEQFTQAQAVILDIASKQQRDLRATTNQIAKSINDPKNNLGSLTEFGATFSQKQKDVIKGLVDSGEIVKAQTLILQELMKEYGGSAEAVGKTLYGKRMQVANRWQDALAKIGNELTPVLEKLYDSIENKLIPDLEKLAINIAKYGDKAFDKLAQLHPNYYSPSQRDEELIEVNLNPHVLTSIKNVYADIGAALGKQLSTGFDKTPLARFIEDFKYGLVWRAQIPESERPGRTPEETLKEVIGPAPMATTFQSQFESIDELWRRIQMGAMSTQNRMLQVEQQQADYLRKILDVADKMLAEAPSRSQVSTFGR